MAAILNLAILDSATLVFPLKITHTCQDWFPPFAQRRLHSHFPPHHLHKKKLYSFILTQRDDGSHLEFYYVEFRHCHVGFRHLVFFSQIHSKTLSLHSDSDSYQFILTQTYSFSLNLMMTAILNSAILNLAILDSAILVFPLKLTHTCQDWFPPFAQTNFTPTSLPTICTKKNLYSLILTQLDDGSHLEFYYVGFRHCHLGFRHLLIFSQIHSKTLSLYPDSDSN